MRNIKKLFGFAAWILLLFIGDRYGVSYDAKYIALAVFICTVLIGGEDE